MKSRTRALALVASVLLHVALLLLVAHLSVPPPPTAETIEISVNYVSPTTEEAPAPPAPTVEPAPEAKPAAPPLAVLSPRPPLRSRAADVVPPEPVRAGGGEDGASEIGGPKETAGGAGAAGPVREGKGSDAAEVDLSIHSGVGSLALDSGGGRGQGETWRNEPGGFPDPDAIRAAGAAEGKRNIDGWLADGLATARARNGVDPYFVDLGRSMEKEAQVEANKLLSGDAAKDLLAAYQDGASRYTKTGNPYAAGAIPGFAPQIDGDTPLVRSAQQFQGSGMAKGQAVFGGGVGPDALRQKLEMGRTLRDFADGKFGNGLLAIVELRQGGDGKLLSLTLTQPSGNAAFDAHVLRTAPTAVGALGPPPEKGLGLHPGGLRTTWSFEGRIVYKRKLSDMSLMRDGWYLALMGLAGLNTGTFDETTGEVEVPDFRHPEFKLKVKLLKVY